MRRSVFGCPTTEEIHGQPGVPGFWLTVLNNHHLTQDYVKKYDEPILKHLEDISSKLHDEGHGFTLTFVFNDAVNEYFTPSTLIKTYHMIDENVLE